MTAAAFFLLYNLTYHPSYKSGPSLKTHLSVDKGLNKLESFPAVQEITSSFENVNGFIYKISSWHIKRDRSISVRYLSLFNLLTYI